MLHINWASSLKKRSSDDAKDSNKADCQASETEGKLLKSKGIGKSRALYIIKKHEEQPLRDPGFGYQQQLVSGVRTVVLQCKISWCQCKIIMSQWSNKVSSPSAQLEDVL